MNMSPYEVLLNRLANGHTEVKMTGQLTASEYSNLHDRIDGVNFVRFDKESNETTVRVARNRVPPMSSMSQYQLHQAYQDGDITFQEFEYEVERRRT